MTKDEIKAAPERSSAGSARLVYQVDCKCVAGCTKCDQLGYTLIPTPAQCAVTRDALDALLAFRHGDTKHLTQEHARILYAALAAQPPAAPVETCQHEAIIGLDGKWHCQKCAAAIEIATAQNSPAHSSADTVDLTNHHNALKCPYCNPKGLQFAESHERSSADTSDQEG